VIESVISRITNGRRKCGSTGVSPGFDISHMATHARVMMHHFRTSYSEAHMYYEPFSVICLISESPHYGKFHPCEGARDSE
jgi:hypothetical protein